MRYLTVDGYFDGTGIRDAANGGYLEHDEVGISPDLSKRIDVWLEQYWKEFIKGFPDRDKVVELDEEGIRIARRLKKEFPFQNVKLNHYIAVFERVVLLCKICEQQTSNRIESLAIESGCIRE